MLTLLLVLISMVIFCYIIFISNLQQCTFKCIHLVDAFIQSEIDQVMCEWNSFSKVLQIIITVLQWLMFTVKCLFGLFDRMFCFRMCVHACCVCVCVCVFHTNHGCDFRRNHCFQTHTVTRIKWEFKRPLAWSSEFVFELWRKAFHVF